jgi:hypothetical protein
MDRDDSDEEESNEDVLVNVRVSGRDIGKVRKVSRIYL